jgi:hypothetical protein
LSEVSHFHALQRTAGAGERSNRRVWCERVASYPFCEMEKSSAPRVGDGRAFTPVPKWGELGVVLCLLGEKDPFAGIDPFDCLDDFHRDFAQTTKPTTFQLPDTYGSYPKSASRL